ncbi:uncharacterized protein BBA_02359 [Beauveria bassiana ARSEF 2860]|uniref:Uncharacterized protein n=1 Tax=Beauveria bassiana (strain ARSEF 2860) TaxID=655819 RepID=J4US00_BEAB2|nr:uncharacterized protein BBA_02359 [Beauveria bassiana ARSEF 2860]EJP68357.1 hypothetical protein BBA_02359 [Beauveria bassiana ARSEF 2860]
MVTVDTPPLSITIDSPTSSAESWDSNSMHPSPLASHPFRIPTPSFTDLDIPSELQCAPRLFSDSNFSGTRTSYLGGDLHDTFGFADNMRRRRSRDDVAALIEFLRSNEPPASNFMAQPYSNKEEGERGRWVKLNVMGKRRSKSMSRTLPPIRLPDSAVAGVTTGGHRHIAISIPLEASHFGDTPRSQYPVFDKDTQPPVPPLPESVRTYKNDKGVVTVLRPLSPSHNASTIAASPASPRRFDRDYPPQLLRNRRMMPPSPPPSSSPPSSPFDTDHWPLAPTEPEASCVGQQSTAFNDTHEETQSRVAPQFVRAAYPSRGSSMAASPRIKHHHTSSIDEIIAEEEPYNRNPSPMPCEGLVYRSTDRRMGRPPVSLATSTLSRKSTSNLRSEWQAEHGRPARASKATQVISSPVSDRGTSPSPPASILSVKSRREKVRDKKFRDLAALRSSKTGNSSITTAKGSDPSNASLTKDKSVPAVNDQTEPKLSTIMVVVDMNPADEAADQVHVIPPTDDHGPVVELRPESAATTPPTPPSSTETSPLQKHGFDTTRTSLTRRREWQTSREQERKQRESNAAVKMQLRQRSTSNPHEVVPITDPEREILYLYEAYREQRLREMESRVRRLERNGDLWLRALHPMLEDVRSSSSGLHDDNVRDWASDDGGAGAGATTSIDRLTRASQRRRLIRRASLSRERMLEEMVRREERDTLEHEGQHPDVSGMSAIEPLMRELAGGVGECGGGGKQPERSALPPRTHSLPAATRQLSGDVPPMPLRPRPVGSSVRV